MTDSSFPLRVAVCAFLGIFSIGNALALEKLQPTARASATQMVEFNVYLPLQNASELDTLIASQQDPIHPISINGSVPRPFAAVSEQIPATSRELLRPYSRTA